jgi:hypothetical protein
LISHLTIYLKYIDCGFTEKLEFVAFFYRTQILLKLAFSPSISRIIAKAPFK